MTTLTPYLSFNGNCAEAMEFYKSVFGGELNIQKVGDSPMKSEDPRQNDQVMHSELKADSIVLMASDWMMDGHPTPGDNVTLTLSGGGLADIKAYFAKLSEGGTVRQPLQAAFFGTYGDLTDKYGFHWAFQSDEKEA